MNENAQLHELTRSLLSSPAFSEFLKETGGQGLPSTQSSSTAPVVKSEPTPQPSQNDVTTNSVGTQSSQNQQFDTPYVGMTIIPEQPAPLDVYESNTDSWANNMDFSLYDQQVYAVTSLPEGPAIDQITPTIPSEKSSARIVPLPTNEQSKNDAPVIEKMPCAAKPFGTPIETAAQKEDAEFDESDPAFALFSDAPTPTDISTVKTDEPIFGNIQLDKAFGRVELILEDEASDANDVSSGTMERFQRLCSTLEDLSERISSITPQC